MNTDSREIVLLTRFRLTSILGVTLYRRASVRRIYYDPYGTLHGPVFRALVALLGRPRLGAFIDRAARVLRVPLRQVPHGDGVPNYAPLQMAATIDATRFLDELWRDTAYRPDEPVPAGLLNRDELVSLHLKFIGVRVWQLLENVRVIRTLERGPISVRLNRRLWPAGFVSRLEQSEDIRTIDEGRGGALPDLFAGAVVALVRLGACALRWQRHGVDRSSRSFVVATELIDPHTLSGRPAEPNFIAGSLIPSSSILYYIQPNRRRLFRRAPVSLGDATVVDLARVSLTTRDLRFLANGYWQVLCACRERGVPAVALMMYLDYVWKYALLAALFTQFQIDVHVYHAYPVGRVGWRHDSGLVTAACRQHDVHSFSYQTRAHFGYAIEYCFDCFDTYCVWGEWWRETYRNHAAIRSLPVVGDVFLDGMELPKRRRTEPAARTLVVFPCDIHRGEPSYLTLDYAVEFLSEVATAVGRLNRRSTLPALSVVVKPKHPEHAAILGADPRLTAALRAAGVELSYLQDRIHDIAHAASMADYALSLLPTTPGMDLLLAGTPSAYFNKLIWGEPRFDAHPLIVRNADEIEGFLSGRLRVDPGLLESLDPWRDGNSRARICQSILEIVGARRARGAARLTA